MAQSALHYTAAASGDGGRIVMITGEQGVGKTRLAQELGRWVRLQGGLFLEGRWAAWEGAAPYGAVAECLRRGLRQLNPEEAALLVGPYSRDVGRLFPDVVEHIDAGADATQLPPEEQQLRLYEWVSTVVYNLSQKQRLVMFLDDLRLAPQMRLQPHIARRLKESRLLMVYAYREIELIERPVLVAGGNELIRSRLVTDVRLAPLTEAETGRMIAYAFGDAAAAQLQAPAYSINRGNPFFVEEMVRYLIENRAVRRVQDRWEVLDITRMGIPESVKLSVQERVARLGEEVDRAEAQLSEALDWSVGSENRLVESSVAQKLGEAYLASRQYAPAERHLLHALDLVRGSASEVGELGQLPHICKLLLRTGRVAEAREHLTQAQKILSRSSDWGGLNGDLKVAQAMVSVGLGNLNDAEADFQRAVQVYHEYDLPWDEARVCYEWAVALMGVGNNGICSTSRAQALLRSALLLWEPMGASRYAEQCRGKLG